MILNKTLIFIFFYFPYVSSSRLRSWVFKVDFQRLSSVVLYKYTCTHLSLQSRSIMKKYRKLLISYYWVRWEFYYESSLRKKRKIGKIIFTIQCVFHIRYCHRCVRVLIKFSWYFSSKLLPWGYKFHLYNNHN